jgi:hypothetical protein
LGFALGFGLGFHGSRDGQTRLLVVGRGQFDEELRYFGELFAGAEHFDLALGLLDLVLDLKFFALL